MRLSRFCGAKLDEAEKKIEILMKGTDGEWRPEPFRTGEDGEEGGTHGDHEEE